MSVTQPGTTPSANLLSILFIFQKPEDLGTEFKMTACANLHVLLCLELQETQTQRNKSSTANLLTAQQHAHFKCQQHYSTPDLQAKRAKMQQLMNAPSSLFMICGLAVSSLWSKWRLSLETIWLLITPTFKKSNWKTWWRSGQVDPTLCSRQPPQVERILLVLATGARQEWCYALWPMWMLGRREMVRHMWWNSEMYMAILWHETYLDLLSSWSTSPSQMQLITTIICYSSCLVWRCTGSLRHTGFKLTQLGLGMTITDVFLPQIRFAQASCILSQILNFAGGGGRKSHPARQACSAPGCRKKTQHICAMQELVATTMSLSRYRGLTKDLYGWFSPRACIKDHQQEVTELLAGSWS